MNPNHERTTRDMGRVNRRAYRISAASILGIGLLTASLAYLKVPLAVEIGTSLVLVAVLAMLHFMMRIVLAAIEQRARNAVTRVERQFRTELEALKAEHALVITEIVGLQTTHAQMRDDESERDLAVKVNAALLADLRTTAKRIELRMGSFDLASVQDSFASACNQIVTDVNARFDVVDLTLRHLQSANTEAFGAARVRTERVPQAVAEYASMQRRLAPQRITMPLAGDWAMAAGVLAELVDEILHSARARNVCELGSGVSTVWASLALSRKGSGRIVSFEHRRDYLQQTAGLVERFGDPRTVALHYAPLVDRQVEDKVYRWYDTSNLDDSFPIDVLVVDGPPGRGGPKARYPAFPLLRSHLRAGAMIIVDDTIRDAEREMVEDWMILDPALRVEKILEKSTILRWEPAAPTPTGTLSAP